MAERFEDLKAEYANLWQTLQIRPERATAVETIARKLIGFKSRYQAVSSATGVPWFFIAIIHQRESDANFNTHLHNGDPLSARTVHVPAGRPKSGQPPFTWEESAIDALRSEGLNTVSPWIIERLCYQVEAYNGWGYRGRTPPVRSPYLWSFSTHYQSGKYVADRVFSPNAVDQQCGTMPMLRRMMDLDSSISLDGLTAGASGTAATLTAAELSVGARGDLVTQLQTALQQRGYAVGDIDGIYGSQTRDSVIVLQRASNLPQTGVADAATLAALKNAPAAGGPAIKPDDILKTIIGAILGGVNSLPGAPATSTATLPTPAGNDIVATIIRALISAPPVPGAAGSAGTPQVILSPIDKALGGESLAGKKTALAIVAYAVMAILQAVGVVGAGTPAGMIINTLITAFGALGGVSKVDRVIQAITMIAVKH